MDSCNKKQVVFVQHSSHLAGAQKSLSRLLTDPRMKRFSPILLTGAEGWLTQFCTNHSVQWVQLDFPSPRSFRALHLGGLSRFVHKAKKALKPQLHADHSFIVHANDHPDSLIGLYLSKVLNARSFLTMRTPTMSSRDFYKHRCSEHDCVIGVGDDLVQKSREWHQNVHLIYNGVTLNEIQKPNPLLNRTKNKILVLGSLSPRKGWQDFINALILIEDKLPNAKLLEVDFLGDLNNKNPADLLNLHYLKKFRCRFLGVEIDYLSVLQNYSFIVHPSRSESFGMAALECIAGGNLLLAADTGMISQFMPNKSFLYPPGDVSSLAQKIYSFLIDSDIVDLYRLFDFEKAHNLIRERFLTSATVSQLTCLY